MRHRSKINAQTMKRKRNPSQRYAPQERAEAISSLPCFSRTRMQRGARIMNSMNRPRRIPAEPSEMQGGPGLEEDVAMHQAVYQKEAQEKQRHRIHHNPGNFEAAERRHGRTRNLPLNYWCTAFFANGKSRREKRGKPTSCVSQRIAFRNNGKSAGPDRSPGPGQRQAG